MYFLSLSKDGRETKVAVEDEDLNAFLEGKGTALVQLVLSLKELLEENVKPIAEINRN